MRPYGFTLFLENQVEQIINQAESVAKQIITLARKRKVVSEPQRVEECTNLLNSLSSILQKIVASDFSIYINNVEDILNDLYSSIRLIDNRLTQEFPYETWERWEQAKKTLYDIGRQVVEKLKIYEEPEHHSIVRNNPTDRNSFLVAADSLEEKGASDYIITLYRAVGQGNPNHLFAIDSTFDYSNTFLMSDDGIRLFPVFVRGVYQKIVNYRNFYEVNIKVFSNTLPPKSITSIKILSSHMPNVKNPASEEESLQAAKYLCTELNNGNYSFFTQYVDAYVQKVEAEMNLVASRSRTIQPLTQDQIDSRKQNMMRLSSYFS
jgi:hypothetical protein